MPRELSPFELDRELSRVAPRARAAYRALRSGREVTLAVPDVLQDPETLDRLATDKSDPIAPALVRFLYWLELMRRALPREGERVRRYRGERHPLDRPLSGNFTWRELLGHALRDAARRPELLDVLLSRGDALRDAGSRLFELRASYRASPQKAARRSSCRTRNRRARRRRWLEARMMLLQPRSAQSERAATRGLAPEPPTAGPGRYRRATWASCSAAPMLSGLRIELGELPAPLSAASFVRALLRLGAAWHDALAPTSLPFSLAHDPFGLMRAQHGALFARIATSPEFLRRKLGLGKDRALRHARALSRSALLFSRLLALRVLTADAALAGPGALREVFSEQAARTLQFELPPGAAGLLFRPRRGDGQRRAGLLLAAERGRKLAEEHDEDWFRNPRAIEQLRAEARVAPATSCSTEELEAGARALSAALAAQL